MNYFTTAWAHNTIIIDREDQIYRSGSHYSDPGSIREEDVMRGEFTAFEETDNYIYSVGDATPSYDSNKLSKFTRDFIFIDKKYFVIFSLVDAQKYLCLIQDG